MNRRDFLAMIAATGGTQNTLAGQHSQMHASPARLGVSQNTRFLVTSGGKPFFWLADTCWRMISKATRESTELQPDIETYFAQRARQRFNVIQTRITGDGTEPDAYGHAPFKAGDFGRPLVVGGPANDYWDTLDYILDSGQNHGLYFALLPIWGNSVANDHQWVKKPSGIYRYGNFLGRRYGGRHNIVWILGGDMHSPGRGVEDPRRMRMIRALAEGIADGASGASAYDGAADWSHTLMSFHPPGGGRSSSQFLKHEHWLDFNMVQTTTRFNFDNYENIQRDYTRLPAKPVLEGEAAYEHSLPLNREELLERPGQRISPWDVRRAAYWSVFAGGFGFTYGHRNLISWLRKGETSANGGNRPWYESLDTPGARQMAALRSLIESRPFLDRIPDDDLIASGRYNPPDRIVATRDRARTYAMAYAPTRKIIEFVLQSMPASKLTAWWFDPRNGAAKRIGDFAARDSYAFRPPRIGGEDSVEDWVLVVDDASRRYPPPGAIG